MQRYAKRCEPADGNRTSIGGVTITIESSQTVQQHVSYEFIWIRSTYI